MPNQSTELQKPTITSQAQTKPSPLTQKDREAIEYFFTHWMMHGVVIRTESPKEPPKEPFIKEQTTLDLAKTINDSQLGPVRVVMQFEKKSAAKAKLVKGGNMGYQSYILNSDGNKTKGFLSKWDQGYDWMLDVTSFCDADSINLPGFKEYLKERYLSPPTAHEGLLSEYALYSLKRISTLAAVIKNIIDGMKIDESCVCVQ